MQYILFSAFSDFRNKRNEALERDLDNARKQTAQAAGASGQRVARPGIRVQHEQHQQPSQDIQQQQGKYHRPGRASHRGGPPKENFAEKVFRPASEGRTTNKYTSGIPTLTARKHKGHQVHDEELIASGNVGQRRSGRASVRSEMSGNVVSDLEKEEQRGASRSGTGLSGMMGSGGGGARIGNNMIQPIKERRSPISRGRQQGEARGRALNYLRGDLRLDADDDEYDSEDEEIIGDVMQKEHVEHSLNTHTFSMVDNQDDDGYDSDADMIPPTNPDDPNYFDRDNHEHVRKTEKGEYIYDWDAMDWDALMKLKEEGYYDAVGEDEAGGRTFRPPPEDDDKDPIEDAFEYDYYFRDVCDVDNPLLVKPKKEDSKAVLPLKPHGPELDDFLMAVTDHPSKYAKMERKVKHPDSKREPRPIFPKDRKLPDETFVNKYKGYLFVTGLVPHLDDETGEVQDFGEELNRQTIAEDVAKLFGVTSMDVSPASPTSAYVGFDTKLKAKQAMIDSAADGRLSEKKHSIELRKYDGKDDVSEEEKTFVSASPAGAESILKVTGLPATTTSVELLNSMFPPGSRLEAMFGPLSNEDYFRASSTTALINLASSDLVSRVLSPKSKNVANNANVGVGERPIQVLRAKRERLFSKWVGSYAQSKLGPRLIVTGEVPPHEMFLSHNDMLHISGLPPNVKLSDLATFFQPFSEDRRDVFGSGHIVRCSQGISTGSAYVGFELNGEIDEVIELYKGKATINGCEVTLRPVKDKMLRRGTRETSRPSRSVEELHSDLYDWERHVNPKDIAELEELGIDKGVLDEIMINIRHNNRSFAAGDQSISGERMYQERAVGTHYRDIVKKYLKVLKSCVGTREDPGLMYEAMFSPEQEIDMGLFDMEEERIKDLREKETTV